jgi:hypothetical protein
MHTIRPLLLAALVAGCAVLAGCSLSLFSTEHYHYPESTKNCPRQRKNCPRPCCPRHSGESHVMEGCPAANDGAAQ